MTPAGPAEPILGYRFEPPCAHDDPCHRRLSVCLPPAPTRRHYDPEMVLCQVVSAIGGPEALEIRHPWPFATSGRIYPGRIVLQDRVGKQVEAFGFGGDLEIESDESGTTCIFTSPAPIIPLPESDTLPSLFACEVEVVLAERRAYWEMRGALHEFQARLASKPPFTLYVTCLVAVEEHLQPVAQAGGGQARHILHFVERERSKLQAAGLWPPYVQPVEEAL